MVGELINFLTSTSETLCQVPSHLSASIHVEGREACGAGRTQHLQLSPEQLCHGKCEVVHPPSSSRGLIYTTVSEESAFWLANNKLLVYKYGQHRPYWAIDL